MKKALINFLISKGWKRSNVAGKRISDLMDIVETCYSKESFFDYVNGRYE